MNHAASFILSEFTNPSGEVVFRVSGWLDGKRVRKKVQRSEYANVRNAEIRAWVPKLGGIQYTFRVGKSELTLASRVEDGRVILDDTIGFVVSENTEPDLFWILPAALKAGAKWEEPYDGG
jgi:hypothetical protein